MFIAAVQYSACIYRIADTAVYFSALVRVRKSAAPDESVSEQNTAERYAYRVGRFAVLESDKLAAAASEVDCQSLLGVSELALHTEKAHSRLILTRQNIYIHSGPAEYTLAHLICIADVAQARGRKGMELVAAVCLRILAVFQQLRGQQLYTSVAKSAFTAVPG